MWHWLLRQKRRQMFRYTPVEGAVGDLNTIYKLEISMVSNVIQPDDVLNNYTGILYK